MQFSESKQILITGCYRSGTEYIANILNDHPKIAAASYITNFMRYYYGNFGVSGQNLNRISLLESASKTIKQRWNRTLDVDTVIDNLSMMKDINYGDIYDAMMQQLVLKGTGKSIWAEKTQLVWRKVPDFLEMFPQGKVIIVIRDPRSVLASFKHVTNAPPPLYLGAIFNMFDVMKKGRQFSDIYEGRVCMIKFEDTLVHFESTIVDLIKFVDNNLNSDFTINSSQWKTTSGNKWRSNSSFDISENPASFDKIDAIERWKKHLDSWEVSICEEVNSKNMQYYGYQLSSGLRKFNLDSLQCPVISKYYREWKENEKGIEEFPSDPLDPKNWNKSK